MKKAIATAYKMRLLTIGKILTDPFDGRGLSPRQQEIARLASRGLTNQEIGESLGLLPSYVKIVLDRIRKRLGIKRSRELTELVFEQIEAVIAASGKGA